MGPRRRAVILLACSAPIWAPSACSNGASDEPGARPNILLVLTDDQRYDTLSSTGNSWIETPNFDRLAREGTLFENALVPSSLCCPSRASLLTGQYPHRTGVHNNRPEPALFERCEIFPEQLRRAGYETAFVGKWHLPGSGASPARGFDRWVSFEGQGEYYDQVLNVDGERVESRGFSSDVLTDYALEWIGRPREEPFFLMLALKNCHKPYLPPERHRGRLAAAEVELPASSKDPVESLPEHLRKLRARRTERAALARSNALLGEIRGYLELVLSIDDNLGRLLAALEQSGALDQTMVVATSDNGFLWGEHGLYQKRLAFEPSIRVPLFVRYPALVPSGVRERRPVLNIDLAATFVELAGARIVPGAQGRSLVGLWNGSEPGWRSSTLHYDAFRPRFDQPSEYAVRTSRWKYLCSTAGGGGEALYDLESDPDERVDAASDPEHRAVLEDMRRELRRQMDDLEVPDSWQASAERAGTVPEKGGR